MNKTRDMNSHITALGIIHLVLGLPTVAVGAFMILGSLGVSGISFAAVAGEDTMLAAAVATFLATFGSIGGALVMIPGILECVTGALVLQRSWMGRIGVLIWSALFVTGGAPTLALFAIGVYGFWVMLSEEGERQFR